MLVVLDGEMTALLCFASGVLSALSVLDESGLGYPIAAHSLIFDPELGFEMRSVATPFARRRESCGAVPTRSLHADFGANTSPIEPPAKATLKLAATNTSLPVAYASRTTPHTAVVSSYRVLSGNFGAPNGVVLCTLAEAPVPTLRGTSNGVNCNPSN
jgi:hypothetical protein